MVLYIWVRFHENISNGFQHTEMVEMAVFNVQRAITPRGGKPELWFVYSACRLMVLTYM